jgi:hypothetical protein
MSVPSPLPPVTTPPAGPEPGAAHAGPRPDASTFWPEGPLDAAQRAFDLLTRRPTPLAFDGHGTSGLPQRLLGLEELKRHLLADSTARVTRDTVWRELVMRARRDGPAWVIAAVGIAMPGLRRRAGLLSRGWSSHSADLDSELLLGFLERLRTIDVEVGNICPRLIDAGARAVKRSRHHSEDTTSIHTGTPGSLPPARPWDHPDFVLARAVSRAVIGPEEHLLISETRLGEVRLQEVAERLGVSPVMAAAWRRRAEIAVREAIRDGELRWVGLSPST